MAENSLQDKFQITVPAREEAGEPWADLEHMNSHLVKRVTSRRGTLDLYPRAGGVEHEVRLNNMPPTEISEPVIEAQGMKLYVAGSTDVTDVVNPWDLKRGWARHTMGMTDDEYTGQHADLFYGEAHGTDDGGGPGYDGFVERNNYLDRL